MNSIKIKKNVKRQRWQWWLKLDEVGKDDRNICLQTKWWVSRDGRGTFNYSLTGWKTSGWECKRRMTHPVQTEEPRIDGTDSRRQAPLPCESQQQGEGRGAEGTEGLEQRCMVKEGENVVKLYHTDRVKPKIWHTSLLRGYFHTVIFNLQ